MKLLNEFTSNLIGMALSLTKDYDNAMDLVQDTSIRIFLNKEKVEAMEQKGQEGYAIMTMKNIFIDNHRKKNGVRALKYKQLPEDSANFFVANVDVEDEYIQKEDRLAIEKVLHEVLNQLPVKQKEAIVLQSYGFNVKQIASLQKLNYNNVLSHLLRGKRRALKIIKK